MGEGQKAQSLQPQEGLWAGPEAAAQGLGAGPKSQGLSLEAWEGAGPEAALTQAWGRAVELRLRCGGVGGVALSAEVLPSSGVNGRGHVLREPHPDPQPPSAAVDP